MSVFLGRNQRCFNGTEYDHEKTHGGLDRSRGRPGSSRLLGLLNVRNKMIKNVEGANMSNKSQELNMCRFTALLSQDLSCIGGERERGPNGAK